MGRNGSKVSIWRWMRSTQQVASTGASSSILLRIARATRANRWRLPRNSCQIRRSSWSSAISQVRRRWPHRQSISGQAWCSSVSLTRIRISQRVGTSCGAPPLARRTSRDHFANAAKEFGAEVVISEGYIPDERDFRSTLVRARDANPDGLILISYYSDGALIARQARQVGLKQTICAASSV